MALKRPADTELTGPAKPVPNPFAGVSLFSSPVGSGSLFTAAASQVPPALNSSFSSFASCSAGNSFASTSAPQAPTVVADEKAKSETKNPFSGLSLFASKETSGGPSAPSVIGGGLFTSAASALGASSGAPLGFGSSGFGSSGFASSSSNPVAEAKADPEPKVKNSTSPKGDAESHGHEEDAVEPEGDAESLDAGTTGEEDEEVIYRNDCKLWKLVRDGAVAKPSAESSTPANAAAAGVESINASTATPTQENGWRWQERGCGILHVNRHRKTGGARLVMRMKGVLKLLLNTPVLPKTQYEKVGQKSVRFVGVEAEEESTPIVKYRVTLQSSDQQGRFLEIVKPFL